MTCAPCVSTTQESNVGSDEISDELDEENNYSNDLAQRLVGTPQRVHWGVRFAKFSVLGSELFD